MKSKMSSFPQYPYFACGAKVLVDDRDLAIVKQAWPIGSVFLLAPHYTVDFVDGDKNVKVSMSRVSIKRKK